jgi:hypothetical protein
MKLVNLKAEWELKQSFFHLQNKVFFKKKAAIDAALNEYFVFTLVYN